ncbi:MAG: rRNA maturation RNase YbeY [Bacilli bacterium]
MNEIIVNNSTKYNIDNICIEIVENILEDLSINNASLSINLVTDKKMNDINMQYRNIDKPTDVITFSYEDIINFNELFKIRELGDIFIAVEYVYQNSIKYQHSMAREMSFVLAHGILHTLGYDHQTKKQEEIMFKKQEELIANVILKGSELDEIFN